MYVFDGFMVIKVIFPGLLDVIGWMWMAVGWCQHSQPRRLRYFGRCATAATGGSAFVPDGTWDKATREPSDQSLGYSLSPSGLDGGSPASEASLAGFGKTGLLAANAFVATAWGATKYFCNFLMIGDWPWTGWGRRGGSSATIQRTEFQPQMDPEKHR